MLAENNGKRRSALERMANVMTQLGIKNQLVYKGEQGNDFDLLVSSHGDIPGVPEGAMGQYFFPETPAAENVFYFTGMITIKEKLSDEEAQRIREKTDKINLELLCGQFAVYPEIGFLYKLTIPVSESLGEDELFDTMDIAAAHCMNFVTTYAKRILEN